MSEASARFSGRARQEIKDTLVRLGRLDKDSADSLTDRIELMSWAVSPTDGAIKPSAVRRELEAIQKASVALEKTIGNSNNYTVGAMFRASRNMHEPTVYDLDNIRGSSLATLLQNLEVLKNVVAQALSDTPASKGVLPNVPARFTAYFVAECLWNNGLDTTTYEDGLYFQIARIVFNEVMPEIGDEAYRRHASWTIKNKGNVSVEFYTRSILPHE